MEDFSIRQWKTWFNRVFIWCLIMGYFIKGMDINDMGFKKKS